MSSEEKKGFALGKQNLILMAVSFVLIVLGFLLMTGGSTQTTFNPDIFSTRRITVGPMLSLFGFLAMIVAILWKPKNKK
ncbi:MAG: DUF3098 domain-containing protein [Paludibacteraceae bacterium]|nr:DUF3098 domain-containing protein [Paludibacteraceae bacterium]